MGQRPRGCAAPDGRWTEACVRARGRRMDGSDGRFRVTFGIEEDSFDGTR